MMSCFFVPLLDFHSCTRLNLLFRMHQRGMRVTGPQEREQVVLRMDQSKYLKVTPLTVLLLFMPFSSGLATNLVLGCFRDFNSCILKMAQMLLVYITEEDYKAVCFLFLYILLKVDFLFIQYIPLPHLLSDPCHILTHTNPCFMGQALSTRQLQFHSLSELNVWK